ncbi:MAG: TerC family protein [Chloroflexi bacterium]|nr:TerC family protein [Chloroflexota bacterium]
MLDFLTWDFVVRFLQITAIDLVLSGDNAIVIGMAAASLPRGKRKFAIVMGGGVAIFLRIALTTIATLLMKVPLLSAIGGLVLVWVAYKLLRLDTSAHDHDKDHEVKAASNFRQAILLILTADFMMSLDNVIAVAGAAHGNIGLLIAGLVLSMPLLMTTGGAISMLIDRFKWLVFVGAAAIVFTGARMVLEDTYIEDLLKLHQAAVIGASIAVGLAIPAFFVWLNKQRAGRPGKAKNAAIVPAASDKPGDKCREAGE